MRMRKRSSAFTLVELMILIVIISLVTILVIPSLSRAHELSLENQSIRQITVEGQEAYVFAEGVYEHVEYTNNGGYKLTIIRFKDGSTFAINYQIVPVPFPIGTKIKVVRSVGGHYYRVIKTPDAESPN